VKFIDYVMCIAVAMLLVCVHEGFKREEARIEIVKGNMDYSWNSGE